MTFRICPDCGGKMQKDEHDWNCINCWIETLIMITQEKIEKEVEK